MIDIKLPKYLEERFGNLELSGWDCEEKYYLYFKGNWRYPMGYDDYCGCLPVRSKAEAIHFLREAEEVEEYYDDKGMLHWRKINE